MTSHDMPATTASGPDPDWSQPGGLGIREQRAWATWHLAVVAIASLAVGMAISYSFERPSTGSATTGLVSLGADTSPSSAHPGTATSTSITPTTLADAISPGTTPTTETSTTVASNPASPTTAAGSVTLMPNTVGKGPSELPAFTVSGPWRIGWTFNCAQAPTGSAEFIVSVVAADGSAATAVDQANRSEAGVTPESNPSGSYHLRVQTDPACRWAAKVTTA
ncbi:MAG: hypothetical protein ACYDD7_08215 [Acidimicrobiales bacterium]